MCTTAPGPPKELEKYSLQDGNRHWREHRMNTQLLSGIYADGINTSKAARLYTCGNALGFHVDEDGKKKLEAANFCHVRLCPLCSWRRSLKLFGQTSQILDYMGQNGDYRYIFITLTLRNCSGGELSASLDKLYEAWNRLIRYPEFNAQRKGSQILGYYKTLEVTHNVNPESKAFDTYHPHIHAIFAVKPCYFRKDKNSYYCSHERLKAIWKQAAALEYEPQVSIQAVKGKNNSAEDITSGIAEVCKYSVKSTDYILPDEWQFSHDTVEILDKALAGRRFISMGGVFRKVHRFLHLDDADFGDLIHVDNSDTPSVIDDNLIWYVWHYGYNQYYSLDAIE